MHGQEIRTLVNEKQPAGKHSVAWDGTNNSGNQVSSGVYFYQLNEDDKPLQTKKLMLLK